MWLKFTQNVAFTMAFKASAQLLVYLYLLVPYLIKFFVPPKCLLITKFVFCSSTFIYSPFLEWPASSSFPTLIPKLWLNIQFLNKLADSFATFGKYQLSLFHGGKIFSLVSHSILCWNFLGHLTRPTKCFS